MSDCTTKHSDYNSENLYTWCTNCGNYGIHGALKSALADECIAPHKALLCFDIGCNGNGADKISSYTVHGLHGRVIPFATGAQLANRRMTVIASGGDGATLGEGINHLIHAVRANYNITFILHNNSNYGLTTGQASATTPEGSVMNTSPDGVMAAPLNVLELIFALQPTFVARSFSGDIKQMIRVFRAGIQHKGFSFIELLQHCPTYNKVTPHEWYRDRVYDVAGLHGYDLTDAKRAREVSLDLTERIATGVIYQISTPEYYDRLLNRQSIKSDLVGEVQNYDVDQFLRKYR